jgi:hypothetical protein
LTFGSRRRWRARTGAEPALKALEPVLRERVRSLIGPVSLHHPGTTVRGVFA